MGLTVRDALVYALENLEKMGFKKFRNKLPEIEVKPNYRRIPRGKLEDKDWGDVADLIREYYKDVYGVEVTLEVLDKINEKKVAEDLQKQLQNVNRFVRLNQVEELRCLPPKARPTMLHLSDTGEVMCSVTLEAFYPGYLHIEWKCGREKSTEVLSSQELCEESPDQTSFSVRSQVRIPEDSLRSPESEVHVSWEHEYTNTREQQTRCIKDLLWSPCVDEISILRLEDQLRSCMMCSITGCFPDKPSVSWYKKENGVTSAVQDSKDTETKIEPHKSKNGCTAVLHFTPDAKKDQGSEFICKVEHPSLEHPIERSSGPLHILRQANVSFIIRDIAGPPKLIDGEKATLYYTVDHCPEDLSVTWLMRRDGQVQEIQISQMSEEESLLGTSYVIRSQWEGRQYVTSLSFIPHMERHKGVTFICRSVSNQHNDEKTFHCKTIYVKPRLSQPVTRSLFIYGEMKYLLNLENFYPASIRIKWRCGVGGSEDIISSTESLVDNPDTTYSVYSEVRIPEDHHKDPGFTVRVTWKHESMERPESRELSIRDSDYTWRPVVEDIQITHLVRDKPAILQCDISGYFPDEIDVVWWSLSPEASCEEPEPAARQSVTFRRAANNTYSCTAYLTVTHPQEKCQLREYICVLNHPTLEQPIAESTGWLLANDFRWRPIVGKIQIPRLVHGVPVVLRCKIAGYFRNKIYVKWWRVGELKKVNVQRVKSRSADHNTYSCTARLPITPTLGEHQGAEYVCVVNHPALEKPIERSTGRLQVTAKPTLSEPVMRSVFINGEMNYLLILENFYPASIRIKWRCGVGGSEDVISSTEALDDNPDRTYSVSSRVRIPEDRHKDPIFTVRVTWEHESMESPESRELSITDPDYRWRPVVGEIQIPRLDHGVPAVLQCDISGYFPDAITVIWWRRAGHKNYEVADGAANQSVTSMRANDNTYSCIACLTITPTLGTHQGAKYICEVDHPALEKPIDRSTGRLQVIGLNQHSYLVSRKKWISEQMR
ncbi:uncharacterized protein [Eleutherodactylus coqui]|uniref:uncharacterized protein isoform X2 n=1 Tax=Eleutherodactylus coqui TaxID=57060 RepID=UPI003461EAC3